MRTALVALGLMLAVSSAVAARFVESNELKVVVSGLN